MTDIGQAWPNMVMLSPDEGLSRRYLRILHIRRDTNEIALFDLDDPCAIPFWTSLEEVEAQVTAGEMERCDDPSPSTMRLDDELTQRELAERERRWSAIRPIVESEERDDLNERKRQEWTRERVVELAEAKRAEDGLGAKGPRADKLLKYLRLYWRGGQLPNALVPAYVARGAPGKLRVQAEGAPKVGRVPHQAGPVLKVGINVTQDILKRLMTAGVSLRKKRDTTDEEAFNRFIELYFTRRIVQNGVSTRVKLPSDQRITMRQFVYHTDKELTALSRLTARKGEVAVAQRHRPKLGNTNHLRFGPGSVYQIDATVGDIYLRSRDNPKRLVGRPVVYIVIDMYTKMIVGFAVALHGPSWEVAAQALENTFSDKVSYCASLGIVIESKQWPARHGCKGLMGDRGWDHLSKHAGSAQELFRYKLSNLPPYRADLKGLVENQFNFLKGTVKFVPGDWRARPKGERPNRLDGAMTLPEFEKFLVLQILKRNATHQVLVPPDDWDGARGSVPTPNMLWEHGVVAQGTPDQVDLMRLRRGLLKVGEARTSREGLMFRSLTYVPEGEHAIPGDPFLRLKGRKWRDIVVKYAEADSSRIFVPMDRGEDLVPFVRPRNSRFAGWRFEEVADWTAAQTAEKREATDRDAMEEAHWNAQLGQHDKDVRASGSDDVVSTRRPHADVEARAAEVLDARVAQAALALAPKEAQAVTAPEGRPTVGILPQSTSKAALRPNRLGLLQRARNEAIGT